MAKRRTNGEGNLRQRADGRWEITIMDGFRDDGKRKTKSFFGKTQKEVKAKAKTYFEAKAAGLVTETAYYFSDWAELWFEHHQDNIAPTTQENYRYTLRILNEGFARRRIADVKPYDIEMFLKKLRRDGRSDSGIAQCRGMLYQIFNKAEANDLIRKNPVRFAEKMRRTGAVKRKENFTAEEVRILMEHLPDERIGWGIKLMLGTGMRTQELLALEPRHIEPDGSCIHVRQAINMGNVVRAQQLLDDIAVHDAEWHFLSGAVAYRKGWLDEAQRNYQIACSMEPNNAEYQQALQMLRYGGNPMYRQTSYQNGCDGCDICTALMCLNCLCGR